LEHEIHDEEEATGHDDNEKDLQVLLVMWLNMEKVRIELTLKMKN
jgi:hypothetical protein